MSETTNQAVAAGCSHESEPQYEVCLKIEYRIPCNGLSSFPYSNFKDMRNVRPQLDS